MTKSKEISLYIHIPFCVKKCLYCDFISARADESTQNKYVKKLVKEMIEESSLFVDYKVITIFLGGGTPSILEVDLMQEIMDTAHRYYDIATDAEITIEFNPASAKEVSGELDSGIVESDLEYKLARYLEMGINRLSIGLQSTDNRELLLLGRSHTYEDFLDTYNIARKVGFNNINIDLMSAIPSQTYDSYVTTLQRVCELEPEHISAYSLIVEEGTVFYNIYGDEDCIKVHPKTNQVEALVDEDTERNIYEFTMEYLKKRGYNRYEISNYAKNGCECKHNKVYWQRGNYIGFGDAAASMVDNTRWTNEPNFSNKTQLSQREQIEEFVFLGLRMMEGISRDRFSALYGIDIDKVYGGIIGRLVEDGLLACEEDRIRLTKKGIDVSNYVMAQFIE